MANILFTWELGSNLGHLDKLLTLMQLAQQQGHRLSVALKSLTYADRVLKGLDYRCFQAPYRQALNPRPTPQCLSYAHTLEDFCFSESGELCLRIRAWREIFDAVAPDLIYCEFSPGALIASRGLGLPTVAFGNGFMVPPASPLDGVFAPFPTTPRDAGTLARLRENDARMLSMLNAGCRRAGVPVFESLGEIFGQVDQRYIFSVPELDQFGPREDARYLGMHPPVGKGELRWPVSGSPRVFCYLQEFPGLPRVLEDLTAAGLAVVLYTHEPPTSLKEQFRHVPNIRFSSELMDLATLHEEAAFVVHHAGHGLGVMCFLTGLPQLSIPMQQEQLLAALQLERAGVGITALHNQPSFAAEIRALTTDDRYHTRAQRFRDKYADFSWAQSEACLVSDMSRLLDH